MPYPTARIHANPSSTTLNPLLSEWIASLFNESPAEKYRCIREYLCREMEGMGVLRYTSVKLHIMQQYTALVALIDAQMAQATLNWPEETAHIKSCGCAAPFVENAPCLMNRDYQVHLHGWPITQELSRAKGNTGNGATNTLIGEMPANVHVLDDKATTAPQTTFEVIGRCMRDLRERRNECLAIHSLPTTVLENIFYYTTDVHRGSAGNFRLGQVCRIWRLVALQCGRLWSHIVANQGHSVVSALLSRSNTASLDVYLTPPTTVSDIRIATEENETTFIGSPNVLQLILSQLPRIRALHLVLSRKRFATFAHLLAIRAPRLKTLTLSIGALGTFATCGALTAPLPEIVFNLPALRVINSTGLHARLAWPLVAGAPSSITHLKIRVPHQLQDEDSLHADTLLVTLQSLTSLIALDLGSHILPFPIVVGATRSRTLVNCRFLRTLHLSGEMSYLNWFLDHLQLSSSVNMDLAIFTNSIITVDQYAVFSGHLHRILNSTHHRGSDLNYASCIWRPNSGHPRINPSVLHLLFSDGADPIDEYFSAGGVDGYRNTSFYSWEVIEGALDPSRTQVFSPNGRHVLSIWMLDTLRDRSHRERVESIWSSLPLGQVHALSLDGIPADFPEGSELHKPSRAFMNYVFPMTSVSRLTVRGWAPDWLEELLTPDPKKYQDVEWTVRIPFPSLQSLTLIGNHGLVNPEPKSLFHSRLATVLHSRRDYRPSSQTSQIQEIVLDKYVDRDGAFALRDWVPRCIRNGEVMW